MQRLTLFHPRASGFTLIEMLTTTSLIAVLMGLMAPVLGKARTTANLAKESVNLRSLHLAAITYAQSNKGNLPGLAGNGDYAGQTNGTPNDFLGYYYGAATNAAGAAAVPSVDACNNYAQAVLLEEHGTNPAQWISPGESGETSADPVAMAPALPYAGGTDLAALPAIGAAGRVCHLNNSFAMLAYGAAGLKPEWRATFNPQAVVMGSRMLFGANHAGQGAGISSLWTEAGSGQFRGAVVRGDNSTAMAVFTQADCATSFSTLHYGAVSGHAAAVATDVVAGPYGKAALAGAGTDTYGTAAGAFGAKTDAAGLFQTAMLGSADN